MKERNVLYNLQFVIVLIVIYQCNIKLFAKFNTSCKYILYRYRINNTIVLINEVREMEFRTRCLIDSRTKESDNGVIKFLRSRNMIALTEFLIPRYTWSLRARTRVSRKRQCELVTSGMWMDTVFHRFVAIEGNLPGGARDAVVCLQRQRPHSLHSICPFFFVVPRLIPPSSVSIVPAALHADFVRWSPPRAN